jgi:2-dehydro-3-deoxygluconokinase
MTTIAAIGECMIELSEHPDGRITRAFGGDTLNTAVYLVRSGVAVDYVTGLGDDGWSDQMLAFWRAEGVGTEQVVRFAGRVPGLYIIQTDAKGERRFSYWRDHSPARDIFACAKTDALVARLAAMPWLYVSGISLSLYGAAGRARLFAAIDACRANFGRFAFDTNYRARGWPDRGEAQGAFRAALGRADLVFAGAEDLQPVFGATFEAELERLPAEVVLKLATPSCRVRAGRETRTIAAPPVSGVIDTTAAGDSFAAGYLASRLAGASPWEAAAAGHHLAGTVVCHPGAIIPRAAMPTPFRSSPTP